MGNERRKQNENGHESVRLHSGLQKNSGSSKMKVLYLGHQNEPTGWGRAALDNILALGAAGVDVVCRNIDLTGQVNTPPELVEFERKDCHDATHCVQHVLPHHLVGTTKYKKNIAYFVSETYETNHLDWNSHLQLVDELWVPNDGLRSDLSMEGFKASVVHHCCDPTKYAKSYPEVKIPGADHTFKFYCISDFNDRKNIESVVRCFHSEFDRSEPVSLILKLNKFNIPAEKVKHQIEGLCNNIKIRSRLYSNKEDYHKEFVITGHSTEDQIMSLHQYGDCFLNFSHGEAWSIPAFDAMAFGNTPIVTDLPGTSEYIQWDEDEVGYCVSCQSSVCDSVDAAFPDLFTARDTWRQIDESEAKRTMRHYYENRVDRRSRGLKRAKDFSHQLVGNTMKELLLA